MYSIEADGTILKTSYESKGAVAKLLNVQHGIITSHLDKWIKGGIRGNYVFSSVLDSLELEKLRVISLLRKYNNSRVWAYNASTLELLLDSFSSMQKAADYFNVDYRSILNHLDTKLGTIKGGKLVLLFSHELSQSEIELLLNNVQKSANETVSVWVYKSVNEKLVLLTNNKPTYSSSFFKTCFGKTSFPKTRLEASKELKMSTKTINKYLDTHKEYKGLFFFFTVLLYKGKV